MTTVDLTDMEITTRPTAEPIEIVHAGVVMMDEREARQIVTSIKTRIDMARGELLLLHDREGWRALGYRSWGACVKAEFGSSAATLYRQLEAAEIERDVLKDSQVENPAPIPTQQLQQVKALPPAQRAEAFKRADQLAGDQPRTAKHVQQAAAEIARPDLPPEFAIVQRRLDALGHTLSAAWDGQTQRFVVRKDGGTGAVMTWPDVLSRLERIEDQAEYDQEHPAQVAARAEAAEAQPASYSAAAYHAQELADQQLIADAEHAINHGEPALARVLLDQVEVATYARDQLLQTIAEPAPAPARDITIRFTAADCAALVREARLFESSGLTRKLPTIAQALELMLRAIKG